MILVGKCSFNETISTIPKCFDNSIPEEQKLQRVATTPQLSCLTLVMPLDMSCPTVNRYNWLHNYTPAYYGAYVLAQRNFFQLTFILKNAVIAFDELHS